MTSASEEKWRLFNCFFRRVGLRTYQHHCTGVYLISKYYKKIIDSGLWLNTYHIYTVPNFNPTVASNHKKHRDSGGSHSVLDEDSSSPQTSGILTMKM
jgi:hypothetical protein